MKTTLYFILSLGVICASACSSSTPMDAPVSPEVQEPAMGGQDSTDTPGVTAPGQRDDSNDRRPNEANTQPEPTDQATPPEGAGAGADDVQPESEDVQRPWMDDGPAHFVDISDLIDVNPVQRRYGIAITDFDLDGDFEAIVTGYGGPNEVLDWQDGQVVNRYDTAIADSARRAIGVGACDVTGDGAEEIYFLNVDRFGGLGDVSDRLFARSNDGWFDLFETSENQATMNRFSGRSVACLDRNATGQYGIFVANYGGPMKLFEVDSAGAISDVAPDANMDFATGGRSLLVLPGDDGLDIFAGNEGGANFFFENQGDGTFVERASEFGIDDRRETVRGVAALDADDDGRLDVVYGNWEGPHRFYRRTDDGSFVDIAKDDLATPSRIRTVIAADFDNDGYEEIFWNNIGEPNRLFRRQGDAWTQVDIGDALESDGLGTGAAVLDFDGDGRLELLIAHGESGAQALTMYRWGKHMNHFLRVRPKTAAGAPARGAVVRLLHSDGRQQTRIIDSGSGYLCQMEPVAHFGLGGDRDVAEVSIQWPDGTRIVLDQPDADQEVVVPYPQGADTP